jgi:hypothetical protein
MPLLALSVRLVSGICQSGILSHLGGFPHEIERNIKNYETTH